MTEFSLVLALIAIIVLIAPLTIWSFLNRRSKMRKLEHLYNESRQRSYHGSKPWPIKTVAMDTVIPGLTRDEFGVRTAHPITIHGGYVRGGISALETTLLATLASSSERIFEFGTCTGLTTHNLAQNSPDSAKIVTVTLHPDELESTEKDSNDDPGAHEESLSESRFTQFVYEDSPVAHKVEQIFSDSKLLDIEKYRGTMDVVFVDGAHTYSYLKNDTEKALAMLKPGGLLLWHDYRGKSTCPDVFSFINNLSKTLPIHLIEGTTLACHRKEA